MSVNARVARLVTAGAIGALLATTTIAPSAAIPVHSGVAASRFTTMLNSLTVDNVNHAGYVRSLFHMWTDTDNDRCSTRAEVLIAESKTTTTRTVTCKVLTGRWYSPYDKQWPTVASNVDIDHVVALAEAWRSGAYDWSYSRREAFANDLGYGPSLIAVTETSNQAKSDKDPALWLPPVAYRCTYAASWVGIKWRWRLSVNSTEKAALKRILSGCGSVSVPIPRRAF